MPNIRDQIEAEIAEMMDEICEASADIVAREAVEYFKERFEEKEWNGVAWPPAKRPEKRGSLMMRSNRLLESIRSTTVTPERVVITGGDNVDVTYARVHNEGFDGLVDVNAFSRIVKGKPQQVKAHTRKMHIPKRQYMGETEELDERIHKRIETYIKSIIE